MRECEGMRSSHSHWNQVNDCQITIFKQKKLSNCSIHVLLIKGGRYFCTEKKYVPPFVSKNSFAYKRSAMSQ